MEPVLQPAEFLRLTAEILCRQPEIPGFRCKVPAARTTIFLFQRGEGLAFGSDDAVDVEAVFALEVPGGVTEETAEQSGGWIARLGDVAGPAKQSLDSDDVARAIRLIGADRLAEFQATLSVLS